MLRASFKYSYEYMSINSSPITVPRLGLSRIKPTQSTHLGRLLTIRLVSRLTVITRWNSSRG